MKAAHDTVEVLMLMVVRSPVPTAQIISPTIMNGIYSAHQLATGRKDRVMTVLT